MISSPLPSEATNSDRTAIDSQKALAALGNKIRWQIFQMLADGRAMHAALVAREFDRDFDGISKHLRILRSAGLLKSRRATDRRVEQYFIPAEYRTRAGEIDLGFCLLRIEEAAPDRISPGPKVESHPHSAPAESGEIREEEEPIQGFGEMLVKNAAMGHGYDY